MKFCQAKRVYQFFFVVAFSGYANINQVFNIPFMTLGGFWSVVSAAVDETDYIRWVIKTIKYDLKINCVELKID